MTIKLLVACTEARRAEVLLLELQRGIPQVAGAASGTEGALAAATAMQPDVILLELPAGDEAALWTLLAQLAQASPASRVLLLCDAYTDAVAGRFIQHGVAGCLLSGGDPSLRAKAVAAVHSGQPWFKRSILLQALRRRVMGESGMAPDDFTRESLLTAREQEIVDLIGSALTNKEIGRHLRISDKTVKAHLHHIYVKLHQSGRYKAFIASQPDETASRSEQPGPGRDS